jgi:hypothetical protein
LFADPLGDPEFWGFAVSETRLELTIAPAMNRKPGEHAGLPLDVTLAEILRGVTDLVNRFLTEAGFSAISLSVDGPPAP